METHAQGLVQPAFGHFPQRAVDSPRESAEMDEALPDDEDVKWRRFGLFLCLCSCATTLLLFLAAYRVVFG